MKIAFTDTSTIVAAKDQVSCDLAGEAAILSMKNGIYYGLNPLGARVWNLIQKPTTVKAVRETLLAEYDVKRERCDTDLRVLLDQLAEHGLIEVS